MYCSLAALVTKLRRGKLDIAAKHEVMPHSKLQVCELRTSPEQKVGLLMQQE
jgi:hypothetical protein